VVPNLKGYAEGEALSLDEHLRVVPAYATGGLRRWCVTPPPPCSAKRLHGYALESQSRVCVVEVMRFEAVNSLWLSLVSVRTVWLKTMLEFDVSGMICVTLLLGVGRRVVVRVRVRIVQHGVRASLWPNASY
jgi:hypothetical protein